MKTALFISSVKYSVDISSLSYASYKDLPHLWSKCPAMLTVFCIKVFCHNEENFVCLVLCTQEVSPDYYHLLNPCRLNSQIHYFQQEVDQFWEDFENWQFWLLRHPLNQSKSYPHFFAAFGQRTFPKLHQQKLLVNVTKLFLPPFQAQAEMTSQISLSCLKLSHRRVQVKRKSSLMRSQEYLSLKFIILTNFLSFDQI